MTTIQTHTNKLIDSSSPYLLQHAHNPVDWYPWGPEAFERAKQEDKPIFLSIGYSTCHWCHVMAHESFEDEEVAKLLNDNFICIKVDREERPDIDQLYMTAATSLIGRGGWPLTIVMGPDRRPFFAGTYFPKHSAPGRVGMLELLPRITDAWHNQRAEVDQAAAQIIESLQQQETSTGGQVLGQQVLTNASAQFSQNYDSKFGGFGPAPKFPSPHNLIFLMREGHRSGDQATIDMALHTLREMRLGGIYDQIGFGFHRYSTDAKWLLPHFEKMLYDQAMLLMAYTEAWKISGDSFFRQTMDEIIVYMQDKLKSPEGAFYAAEDADSDGEEGKFYVWQWDELKDVLGLELLHDLAESFGLKPEGNFQDESSGDDAGTNIFHLKSLDHYSKMQASSTWQDARETLYNLREERVHPGLDNKILGDWNGLVLTALSKAARATHDETTAKIAGDLADYILDYLLGEDGQLLHMPPQKGHVIQGFLDDYSFVIEGLRAYYEVSFQPEYLKAALALQEIQIQHFWDKESGGFFFTAEGDSELFIRQKEIYDGAIPSGNSVAASNLYYLGRLAEKPEWESMAMAIGTAFSAQVNRAPRGFSALLQSVQVQVNGSKEVVIAGNAEDLQKALDIIRNSYDPFRLVLYRPLHNSAAIEAISSFLIHQKAIDEKFTVYICENYACQTPLTSPHSLENALQTEAQD